MYGYGLEGLRERIPGPAGTTVRLGFKTQQGSFYEVDLSRTAYGGGTGEEQQQPQQQMAYGTGTQVTSLATPHARYRDGERDRGGC